jgi:hypothetical protein
MVTVTVTVTVVGNVLLGVLTVGLAAAARRVKM